MANDLNLKKSWNPKSFKNREAVWKKEKEVYDLYKQNQSRHNHSQKLKEENELLALATASADVSTESKKTRWMYKSDEKTSDNGVKGEETDMRKEEKRKEIHRGINQIVNHNKDYKETIKPRSDQILSKDDPMYAIQLERSKRKSSAIRRKRVNSSEQSHLNSKKRSYSDDSNIDDVKGNKRNKHIR
ncbi:hypothetical protein CANINC_004847 [Pichia inconspicua]|uniref:Pre-mRNA-splicing factor CWC25 n=1 Tax=Pichia inconspicua TaxID=52247 RepID=A0A4V4NF38_9ASCO|nr:hypothetical protein CANINC_004847 [[Candida] inconspicua]